MTDKNSEHLQSLQALVIADCNNPDAKGSATLREIEAAMPSFTDAELLQLVDTAKQMALSGQGVLYQVNWILGMMLQAFSERLLPYQDQFVDELMAHALKLYKGPPSWVSTLYFGLCQYDLGKYFEVITEMLLDNKFFEHNSAEQLFNLCRAYSTIDYSKISKKRIMAQLYLLRKFRRENGFIYNDLKQWQADHICWDIDHIIWRLRYALIYRY